jgi:hypothetical protein
MALFVTFCHLLSPLPGARPEVASGRTDSPEKNLTETLPKLDRFLILQGREATQSTPGKGRLGNQVHLRALLYTSVHLKWIFRGLGPRGKLFLMFLVSGSRLGLGWLWWEPSTPPCTFVHLRAPEMDFSRFGTQPTAAGDGHNPPRARALRGDGRRFNLEGGVRVWSHPRIGFMTGVEGSNPVGFGKGVMRIIFI